MLEEVDLPKVVLGDQYALRIKGNFAWDVENCDEPTLRGKDFVCCIC